MSDSTAPPQTALATRIDVQALIDKALEKDSGIETVQKLLDMAERVKKESARDAFNAAVAAFQGECPPILKSERADVRSRSGPGYSYNYAPLEEITRTVSPVLAKHGLSFRWSQRFEKDVVVLNCRLSHVLGHFEESGELALPTGQGSADGMGATPAQRVGIASTYGKRYTLLAVLGIAPEDDPDARMGDDEAGSGVKQPRRREQTLETEAGPAFYVTLPEGAPVNSTVELRGQIAKIDVRHSPEGAPKAWTRWDLFTANGAKVATFDSKLAEIAEAFRQSQELVAMTCKNAGRGWGVTEIWAADQPPGE